VESDTLQLRFPNKLREGANVKKDAVSAGNVLLPGNAARRKDAFLQQELTTSWSSS